MNTLTIPGETKYLPGTNEQLIATFIVREADEGMYEQRVAVWKIGPCRYIAARIEASPLPTGWNAVSWDEADEWWTFVFDRIERVPAVLAYLMDEEGVVPWPEGVAPWRGE
jgi:hypothetical protein